MYVCAIAQSCPTLCDPIDCSLPGSSVHGIFPGKNTRMGCRFLLQGIFLASLASPALAGGFLTTEPPGKPGGWQLTNTFLDDFMDEASSLKLRTEIESIFRMTIFKNMTALYVMDK